MKVGVHLRPNSNATNARSLCLAEALAEEGHQIVYKDRSEAIDKTVDLYVQTGFAASTGLRSAIDARIPYIIMEAPVFRSYDLNTHSSWGYNGLQGGAWRPQAPEQEREKPTLKPPHDGPTLIIGQKPTDHSLRGSDHVKWILDRQAELPDADFRPHPLMVPHGALEPIDEALQSYGSVITYTSTVGVDGVIAGCRVRADNRLSAAYGVDDRERWLHNLSWWQAANTQVHDLLPYILSGYEEARTRMDDGLCEHPRERVDGHAIQQRYYQLILQAANDQGASWL